jgi:hypothetical protein
LTFLFFTSPETSNTVPLGVSNRRFFRNTQPNYIELEAGNVYGGDLHHERRTDLRAVFKLLLPFYGTDTEKQYPRSDPIELENNIVIVVGVIIGVILIRWVLFLRFVAHRREENEAASWTAAG